MFVQQFVSYVRCYRKCSIMNLLLERADAERLSIAAYSERLLNADEAGEEELKSLEGLRSGDSIQAGPGH